VSASGSTVTLGNLSLTTAITIPPGVTLAVPSGVTLDLVANHQSITLGDGAVLTVDGVVNAEASYNYGNSAVFIPGNGGLVVDSATGSPATINGNGKATMNGGVIKNNRATWGDGTTSILTTNQTLHGAALFCRTGPGRGALKNMRELAVNKIMRFLKYLLTIWITLAVYTASAFFLGSTGTYAYEQLLTERNKQKTNIEALRSLNQELEGTLNSLKYDSDTIRIYARELGYGRRDETFVRIVGLGGAKKQRTTAGQLTIPRAPRYVPDTILWFFAFCAGIGTLLLISVSEFMRERRIRWRKSG
jgi:cell division protein FtsB